MLLCSANKWTYAEYQSNPNWFNKMLRDKLETEAEYDRNNQPKPSK